MALAVTTTFVCLEPEDGLALNSANVHSTLYVSMCFYNCRTMLVPWTCWIHSRSYQWSWRFCRSVS